MKTATTEGLLTEPTNERGKGGIEEIKKWFKRYISTEEEFNRALQITLKKIKFLEGIYMTGGEYSKEFKESAYKERQSICLESSALYSILREMQGEQCKN